MYAMKGPYAKLAYLHIFPDLSHGDEVDQATNEGNGQLDFFGSLERGESWVTDRLRERLDVSGGAFEEGCKFSLLQHPTNNIVVLGYLPQKLAQGEPDPIFQS